MEYSKEDFYKFYNDQIVPYIEAMPMIAGRVTDKFAHWTFLSTPIRTIIYSVSGGVAFFVFFLFSPRAHINTTIFTFSNSYGRYVAVAGVCCAIISIATYRSVLMYKREFDAKIKEAARLRAEVMKKVSSFFGLEYKETALLDEVNLIKSRIVSGAKAVEICNPMRGKKDGFLLEIMEICFKARQEKGLPVMSEGLLAVYDLDKKFEGVTLLLKDSLTGKISERLFSSLHRVKLEWPDFEADFDLYSTSQVDARIVMDPHFMQAIYEYNKKYGLEDLYISFFENKMFVYLQNSIWPYMTVDQIELDRYFDNITMLLNLPQQLGYASLLHEDFAEIRVGNAPRQTLSEAAGIIPVVDSADVKPLRKAEPTPLISAVVEGNKNQVSALLATYGGAADINAQLELNGNTALHVAVWNNYGDIVALLLQCPQINVGIKNDEGKTALELANSNGFYDIAAMLKAH